MRISDSWHKVRFFCLLAAALALVGCATSNFFQQNLATRLDEAASIHVAVLAVAPWKEYRDAMQPSFSITTTDAFNQALPSTLALEERMLDAVGVRVKAAPPGTSFSGAVTGSGDISKISFEPSPAGDRTAASLPPAQSDLGKSLGEGQMLKYRAATALYQEVQLLNRYIKDAAIHEAYSPYLVRLQVSLMPYMQNEPYDAYTMISFFSGEFEPCPGMKSIQASSKGVRIIPLLVTDDIEMAVHNHSMDQVRQYALALSAMFQGVGIGADLQKVSEKLQTAVGRDLNSTFTVARVSDNTLRCRFGAQYQSNSKYAMVPQTHNVTLVVLVPNTLSVDQNKDAEASIMRRTVRLIAKTTLTNTQTGKNLESRSHSDTHAATERFLRDLSEKDANDLHCYFMSNNWEKFSSRIKEIQGSRDDKVPGEYLWADFAIVRLGSSYASATFVVPEDPGQPPLDKEQTPILIDDGKNYSVVKLRSVVARESDKLAADLIIGEKKLPHSELKVSSDGKEIEIKFPSLNACKLADKGKPCVPCVSLCVTDSRCNEPLLHTECSYLASSPDPPKSPCNLTARASVINADKEGNGKLAIIFTGPPDKMNILLSIKGADVQISGSGVTAKDEGWSVRGPGTLNLALSNLNPISSVTISAKDTIQNVPLSPIVLPVVRQVESK